MNQFKVGLMALIAMGMVAYMSLIITANQSGFGEYVTYRTIVRDASGIFPKTPIKVAGINAGRIVDIKLEGNRALIFFEVLEKVKITTNSMLKIRTVGFLGDKYLEIYIGDSNQFLSSQGFIIAEEGAGLEKLMKDAGEVMKDVKDLVKSVKDSVAPPGQEPPITKILADVQELVNNAKEVSASLKRIMDGNEEKINNIAEDLESFSRQIAFHTNKNEPESAISDVRKILANAEKLTGDLKDMIADVKSGHGTLGKFIVEEDIANEVTQTLAGVKKIVSKVDNIRTELEVFTGANTSYGSESTAGLRIYPAPERFYHLGISTSEFGPEKEFQRTKILNGVENRELERTRIKDQMRFDIQLGRKIHNWSFRGGLIESTGGLGVDYEFYDFGTRVVAEAFDYRKDEGLNLRIKTEVQIWNVIHGRISGEDLANDTRSATISAGLRFSDEDLKGLLGFFL